MRPLWSYYGSKWTMARHFGPPRRDLVIEPFAGSAGYSVWWEAPNVRLYDLDSDVVAAWDWLIHCSEEDVRRVPAKFRSQEEWRALPDGIRQVVFWNICYCRCAVGKQLPDWYIEYCRTGKVSGPLLNHRDLNPGKGINSLRYWEDRVKERLIAQKPLIAKWTVEQASYRDIPLVEAHWHVDPPYAASPGRAYVHDQVDYDHLAQWCRSLPGAVDVCEQEGADWLPFRPLGNVSAMANKVSHEAVWRNEPVDLLDLAREEAA